MVPSEALWLIEETAPEGGFHVATLNLDIAGGPVLPVASRLARLDVPFVFVTGDKQGYNTSGHQAPVLQKPFVMEELITTWRRLRPLPGDAGFRASSRVRMRSKPMHRRCLLLGEGSTPRMVGDWREAERQGLARSGMAAHRLKSKRSGHRSAVLVRP
jgi:hypothetical protein